MTNHYEKIALFTARALAHSAESQEMENKIKEECVNKYIDEQIKLAIEKTKKSYGESNKNS